MEYKDIIREAASRKVMDLAKFFLDVIDELRLEDNAKIEKFRKVSDMINKQEDLEVILPFLYLIDDNKKEGLRKRILDRANELKRELEE